MSDAVWHHVVAPKKPVNPPAETTKTYPIFNSNTPRIDNVENTDYMSKELTKKCPYCGSKNIDDHSEKETKCLDCGMGKYTSGER